MVNFPDLQYSQMYKFARNNASGIITQIPNIGYWQAGTTTMLNSLDGTPGWNLKPTQAQGGDDSTTFFDLVYGNKAGSSLSNNFIYNGPLAPYLSGIYGVANTGMTVPLWDATLSLEGQTLNTRLINVALVSDTTSTGWPGWPNTTSIKNGNVGRSLNVPNPTWHCVTITDIPKDASCIRIFQDRYTGAGNPPNDNYAIASVGITFSGTYKAS
jgi:hypothetical protein